MPVRDRRELFCSEHNLRWRWSLAMIPGLLRGQISLVSEVEDLAILTTSVTRFLGW